MLVQIHLKKQVIITDGVNLQEKMYTTKMNPFQAYMEDFQKEKIILFHKYLLSIHLTI